MKWRNLSKRKKILILAGLAIGCVATLCASYILKGNINLVSEESGNAEAFPLDIDGETSTPPTSGAISFLGIPGPGSFTTKPNTKYSTKTNRVRPHSDAQTGILSADNSTGVSDKSGSRRLQGEKPSNPPGDLIGSGAQDGITEDSGTSALLAGISYNTYDKDIGGESNASLNVTTAHSSNTGNGGAGRTYSNGGQSETENPGNTSPVPEPSTMILLGTGLVGLAVYGRKRLHNNGS